MTGRSRQPEPWRTLWALGRMSGLESTTTLELFAPAKNLECGQAAIDGEADAVYVGGPMVTRTWSAQRAVDGPGELFDGVGLREPSQALADRELGALARRVTAGQDRLLLGE